jgi:hypothetical protein
MQLATHVTLWCSVGVSTVLGAVGLVNRSVVEPIAAPAMISEPAIAVVSDPPTAIVASEDPTPPPMIRYGFVIDEAKTTTYVKLTASPDRVKHGKPVLAHTDFEWSAAAEVAPGDLPGTLPRLLGRAMIVDGSCTATVTGFAVLSRLTGDPAYAGQTDEAWTARSVFAKGEKQLVAQLSRECAAKPDQHDRFARDAALPAAIAGTLVELDRDTREAVKRDLFASELGVAADTAWNDPNWGAPPPDEKPWRESVEVSENAYTHATTGERWITIRAFYGGACGMKSVDLAAIYRERDGHRTRVWSGTGKAIENLVDIDGDGAFEFLSIGGFGDEQRALETLADAPVDTLALPFFGCPC